MEGDQTMKSDAGRAASGISELVRPSLTHLGIELVDVRWSGPGRGALLTLVIDRPGGVTLGDCERAASAVGPVLDAYDPIETAYRLEVTSPGAERPLHNADDWSRALGRRVNVRYGDADSEMVVEGRLMAVSDGEVEVEVRDRRAKRSARIGVESIQAARVVVDI